MKVLVADKFEKSGLEGLKNLGCDVTYRVDLKDEPSLVETIRSVKPDVLVVRSTQVTEAMLGTGSIKLVVRAGAGYNTIDVAAASKRGIYVSNCPGKNSVAVAELAFALILSLDRRVADNVIALRKGEWNKKEFSKARGLMGRTLGLIGLGKIGLEMVPRAKAFGMPVIAWSRHLTSERAAALGITLCPTPLEVARASDIVSVHVALSQETRGFLDATFLEPCAKAPTLSIPLAAKCWMNPRCSLPCEIEKSEWDWTFTPTNPLRGPETSPPRSQKRLNFTAHITSAPRPIKLKKPLRQKPYASYKSSKIPAKFLMW